MKLCWSRVEAKEIEQPEGRFDEMVDSASLEVAGNY